MPSRWPADLFCFNTKHSIQQAYVRYVAEAILLEVNKPQMVFFHRGDTTE